MIRVAAAALSLAAASSVMAQATFPAHSTTEPSAPVDMAAEIRALRERINTLESRQLEAQSKRDEGSNASQVKLDAQRRSQLLDTGGWTAGHKDGRFFLASEDGKFLLRPFYQLQVRDVTVHRQDFTAGTRDDT